MRADSYKLHNLQVNPELAVMANSEARLKQKAVSTANKLLLPLWRTNTEMHTNPNHRVPGSWTWSHLHPQDPSLCMEQPAIQAAMTISLG